MHGGAQFVIVNRYAEGAKKGAPAGSLYALDLGGFRSRSVLDRHPVRSPARHGARDPFADTAEKLVAGFKE